MQFRILFSCMLSKNIKIKIHKTIIFPVVLYEYETWSLMLPRKQTESVWSISTQKFRKPHSNSSLVTAIRHTAKYRFCITSVTTHSTKQNYNNKSCIYFDSLLPQKYFMTLHQYCSHARNLHGHYGIVFTSAIKIRKNFTLCVTLLFCTHKLVLKLQR
jgi:hypothetical protein